MDPCYSCVSCLLQLMAPDKVLVPERYLDLEDNTPLSPEELREKHKKLERIKTLIAKSKWVHKVNFCLMPVKFFLKGGEGDIPMHFFDTG